nr:MAG TPA: YopX protein [Caudoviricetes sp.]
MREILFKAKRIDNGEWVQGAVLFHDTDATTIFNQHMGDGSLQGFEVNPSTICQYTGLKDKNGNKIWENDIVKTVSDIYAPVKFGLYTTGFALEECNQGFYVDFPDETYLRHELGYWHNKVEVRGNIFDNPELLQEESNE